MDPYKQGVVSRVTMVIFFWGVLIGLSISTLEPSSRPVYVHACF